ncbi:MAG: DUF2961 domain-containing protein [Candidatus Lokiarchaeota archaeon]|nr:DUF2961 domain-containing protein [Candidatus Lokiarchaeota archaeon]MBD3200363.1 DUF2961 domain-containing protein [Candidatus Lokiarchaeota archaeon]
MKLGKSSLRDIAKLRPDSIKRRRLSSYDLYGGNFDWIDIEPGESAILGEVKGAGCITHIWCTCACRSKYYLRNAILRMYWDDEADNTPSVEVPLGDFFGMGHAEKKNFVSLPLQMSPQKGKGFNCWWPMPYSNGFKITLTNENSSKFRLYFYIDYELYENGFEDEHDFGRFHAQWRRENPTKAKTYDPDSGEKYTIFHPVKFVFGGSNRTPVENNYMILEAEGKGQYVGCHINIDNITFFPFFNWPGEGDDMIFIDDDLDNNVITLPGTGTEDYVNQAFGQRQTYSAPYHGTIKPGGLNWFGKITYYRYHIEDPIYFNKKIAVTIEHGHDNHRADDWSTTAYWYQKEPHDHTLFPELLDKEGRKPRKHYTHLIRKGIVIIVLLILFYFVILKPFLALFL